MLAHLTTTLDASNYNLTATASWISPKLCKFIIESLGGPDFIMIAWTPTT
jgi:hypothetical protein